MEKILVVGSYNVGLWVTGPRIPKEGETVLGESFGMGPGGKGSNQAIAVARLGGDMRFLAKVGDDVFGCQALELFRHERIDTETILVDGSAATGAGIIFIDAKGQNAIGVAPGANYNLSPEDIEKNAGLVRGSRFLLMQLETPVPTVLRALQLAREAGAFTILNPAPAQPLGRKVLELVDLLTPNESEAQTLTGIEVRSSEDAFRAAKALRGVGAKAVLVTLGEMGCVYSAEGLDKYFPAPRVQAADTTGAGDAFNGALCFALAEGQAMDEAIRFASRAGAYCATKPGVVDGLGTRADLENLL